MAASLLSIFVLSFAACASVRSALWRILSRFGSVSDHDDAGASRLATLSIESFDSFVASAAASIATGWSEPVPGREFHPLKSSAFHGALFRQLRTFPARAENHRIIPISAS